MTDTKTFGRWRTVASSRVEYKVENRRGVAFLAWMSLDCMALRSASDLSVGGQYELGLFVDGREAPIPLLCHVAQINDDGVVVQFVGDTSELVAWASQDVLPKLASLLETARPNVNKLAELGALYDDLGQEPQALDVYERGLALHRRDLPFHEQAVDFLIRTLARRNVLDQALVNTLNSAIAQGQSISPSEALQAAANELQNLQERFLREQQEAAVRAQQEHINAAVEVRLQEVLAARQAEITAQAQGNVQGELAAVRAALEEDRQALSKAREQHNASVMAWQDMQSQRDQDQRNQVQQGEQATESARLVELTQQVDAQQRETRNLRQALDKQQAARQGLDHEMAQLRATLAEREQSLRQQEQELQALRTQVTTQPATVAVEVTVPQAPPEEPMLVEAAPAEPVLSEPALDATEIKLPEEPTFQTSVHEPPVDMDPALRTHLEPAGDLRPDRTPTPAELASDPAWVQARSTSGRDTLNFGLAGRPPRTYFMSPATWPPYWKPAVAVVIVLLALLVWGLSGDAPVQPALAPAIVKEPAPTAEADTPPPTRKPTTPPAKRNKRRNK